MHAMKNWPDLKLTKQNRTEMLQQTLVTGAQLWTRCLCALARCDYIWQIICKPVLTSQWACLGAADSEQEDKPSPAGWGVLEQNAEFVQLQQGSADLPVQWAEWTESHRGRLSTSKSRTSESGSVLFRALMYVGKVQNGSNTRKNNRISLIKRSRQLKFN